VIPTSSGKTGSPPLAALRLFGGVALQDGNGQELSSALRQPKRLALLVFFILKGGDRSIRRDRLLAMFWPDSDPERAHASLRQSLYFLRKEIHPDLLASRGRADVTIQPGILECDAVRFEEPLQAGRPREALDLYMGDLLDGFFIDGCSEFQDWLEECRTDLRRKAGEGAWAIAHEERAAGDAAQAAYWAKRAQGYSPFTEGDVQRLMGFLDTLGDREGALRAYQGLKIMLAREFQAEPSPETQALVETVRARTVPGPVLLTSKKGRRGDQDRRAFDARRQNDLPLTGEDRRTEKQRRTQADRRTGEDRRNQD